MPRARPARRCASRIPRGCNPALPGTRAPPPPRSPHPRTLVPRTRGFPRTSIPPSPPGPGAALTQVVLSLFVGLHVLPAELVLPAAHAAPARAEHDAKSPAGPRRFEAPTSPPWAAPPPAPAPLSRAVTLPPRRSGILRAPPRRACARLPAPPPQPLRAPAPCRGEGAVLGSEHGPCNHARSPDCVPWVRRVPGPCPRRERGCTEVAARGARVMPAAPGKRPHRAPSRLGASARPRVGSVPRGRQRGRAGGQPQVRASTGSGCAEQSWVSSEPAAPPAIVPRMGGGRGLGSVDRSLGRLGRTPRALQTGPRVSVRLTWYGENPCSDPHPQEGCRFLCRAGRCGRCQACLSHSPVAWLLPESLCEPS